MDQKFRWILNNALITCKEVEDRGLLLILSDGEILYSDNTVSRFDRLLIPRNELEAIQEEQSIQQKIGGRGRRKRGATP